MALKMTSRSVIFMAIIQQDRYSSDVRIRLHIGEHILRVAQVGPASLLLRDLLDWPPGSGTLEVVVDGESQSRTIMLPQGLKP
jgi:hypothetical protein